MNQRNRLKPYIDHLESLGMNIDEVGYTSKAHVKIKVTHQGNQRFFIVSNSSSDNRSFMNWKSDVRRWLKGDQA